MKLVMLVDDKLFLLDLLRQVLEREGYTVLLATDGDEAVKRFEEDGLAGKLIAIISDWSMRRVSGDALFRAVQPRLGATHFVVLTADPDEFRRQNPDIVNARELTAILPKPLPSVFDVVRVIEPRT